MRWQKDWERKADKAAQIILKPIFPIFFRDKCPGQNPTNFLTLRHIDGFEFWDIQVFQQSCELVEIVLFGNQSGEPQNLRFELNTFVDHFLDESLLATFAPKLGLVSAEVENRFLNFIVSKILGLSAIAL